MDLPTIDRSYEVVAVADEDQTTVGRGVDRRLNRDVRRSRPIARVDNV